MAHEPGDHTRLVLAKPVLQAESLGVDGAEFGVIATAALGDVVKQTAEVGDLGLL